MLPPIWHGTLREHYLLLFGVGGVIATVSGGVAAWFGAQFGARRAAREAAEQAIRAVDAITERRLAMLQHGVDTVAVEVERIAESQRYAARLLAERTPRMDDLPRAIPRSEGRVPTPH